jgi:hypothetical protein
MPRAIRAEHLRVNAVLERSEKCSTHCSTFQSAILNPAAMIPPVLS